MMNKLKRNKGRKHVTFRSLSDDTLMLEQINEPIMEEEEPLYDDVGECGDENADKEGAVISQEFNTSSSAISSSKDSSNLGTRRMSSYSSSATTTSSSDDDANDQNNHHSHTNSPSIGSTSGNTLFSLQFLFISSFLFSSLIFLSSLVLNHLIPLEPTVSHTHTRTQRMMAQS